MKVVAVIGGGLAFAVPFLLAFSFIFNFFFDKGAMFLDAGWFADLMWRKNWALPNPSVALVDPAFSPASFYGDHVSPILAIVSAASWLFPSDRVDVFAAYIGLSYGLMGLVMWKILARWRPCNSILWVAISTALSIAFACNGLALSATTYPHIEVLAPPLILATLMLVLEKRLLAGALVGVLALLIREDVGFHFVAILGLVIVVNMVQGCSLFSQRALVIFCTVALLYSIGAIALQRYFYPSTGFQWVYSGSPVYAHLTLEFWLNRLSFLFEARLYIWLPLLAMLVSAAALSNVYIVIGAVAYLPWLGLQLSAVNHLPGALSAHYAYPLIVGVGWTAIACRFYPSGRTVRRANFVAAGCFGLVVASTFIANREAEHFARAAFPTEFALQPHATRAFASAFGEAVPLMGKVRVDAAILSLNPEPFLPTAWLLPQDWDKHGGPDPDIDTLAYFKDGFEQEKANAQQRVMRRAHPFTAPGTNIVVFTTRQLDPSTALAHLLVATPYLLTHFYEDVSGMIWASTRTPAIKVFKCTARKMRMEIVGYAVWPHEVLGGHEAPSADRSMLSVRVAINGTHYRQLEFSRNSRNQFLELPVHCIDNVMTIGFESDYLIVPSLLTSSSDARPLGIGIFGSVTFD